MSSRASASLVLTLIAAVILAIPVRAETTHDAQAWLEKLAVTSQSSPIKARMIGNINMAGLFGAVAEAGQELPPEADAAASMTMTFNAEMFTHGPRLMHMTSKLVMSGMPQAPDAPEGGQMEMSMLQVFDGETMWMEMANPMMGGTMVMKMSLELMEQMGEEMAEKLGLGGGLSFGDPVAQLRMMGEMMDCQVASIENGEVTLAAKLDWEAIQGMMKSVPAEEMEDEQIAQMMDKMGTFRFVLDERTALPKRFVMGDKIDFMTLDFPEYRVIGEAEIPAGIFAYSPPEGAQVMDLGAMMGAMQEQQ